MSFFVGIDGGVSGAYVPGCDGPEDRVRDGGLSGLLRSGDPVGGLGAEMDQGQERLPGGGTGEVFYIRHWLRGADNVRGGDGRPCLQRRRAAGTGGGLREGVPRRRDH